MHETTPPPGATAPVFYEQEEHAHGDGGTLFGFWLYLMSDCLIFAVLFATFGVLGRNYAAGPSGADLFDLRLVAVNTGFLLLSSITFGFAMLEMAEGPRGLDTLVGWRSRVCSERPLSASSSTSSHI